MTKKAFIILAISLTLTLLTSCSHRLVGSWTIQRYESSTAGQQGAVFTNIGTMQFYKNGTGEKKVSYSILDNPYYDNNPFQWALGDDKIVTIVGNNSEFSKTWIMITNKRKYQKWKSTDGANKIQTLELIK